MFLGVAVCMLAKAPQLKGFWALREPKPQAMQTPQETATLNPDV